jgi:hypothetical protein
MAVHPADRLAHRIVEDDQIHVFPESRGNTAEGGGAGEGLFGGGDLGAGGLGQAEPQVRPEDGQVQTVTGLYAVAVPGGPVRLLGGDALHRMVRGPARCGIGPAPVTAKARASASGCCQ